MIRKMIALRATSGETVVLWGDGSPTREFLYVEDCAADRAGRRALRRRRAGQPRRGVGDLHQRISRGSSPRRSDYEGEIVWDTSKPNGQPRRKLDVSRAREYFGFEATVPFEEGIERTVAWWEANCDGYDEPGRSPIGG